MEEALILHCHTARSNLAQFFLASVHGPSSVSTSPPASPNFQRYTVLSPAGHYSARGNLPYEQRCWMTSGGMTANALCKL
jgi:hypothetical protein